MRVCFVLCFILVVACCVSIASSNPRRAPGEIPSGGFGSTAVFIDPVSRQPSFWRRSSIIVPVSLPSLAVWPGAFRSYLLWLFGRAKSFRAWLPYNGRRLVSERGRRRRRSQSRWHVGCRTSSMSASHICLVHTPINTDMALQRTQQNRFPIGSRRWPTTLNNCIMLINLQKMSKIGW